MEDTLIEFIHNFNDKDMGHGKKATYGDYTFLKENTNNVNVIVNCESDQYKLLVNMKAEEIEKEVMAWKVTSYKFILSEEAEEMISLHYSDTDVKKTQEPSKTKNPRDSIIKASKNRAKIYNTPYYDKSQNIVDRKVVSLSLKETKKMRKMLEKYKDSGIEWNFSKISLMVMFNDKEYLISEEGLVLCSMVDTYKKVKTFKMTKKDITKTLSIFDKYQIPH